MDPRLQHPFTCIVAGPTSCGKTQFVKRLLAAKDTMIHEPPKNIIWCYSEYQPAYVELTSQVPGISFVEGIPQTLLEDLDTSVPNLVVLDDMMCESGKDKRVTNLFVRGSHHRNLSVIYIVQNLFYHGKESRTLSLNSHYIVLFKSPRDATQVGILGKQMFPGNSKFMHDAFRDSTKQPYGYLLIDLKPATEEQYRLRTCIFPNETQYVYLPKV
jgi:hypothetical protein